jgi:hypothetical protein
MLRHGHKNSCSWPQRLVHFIDHLFIFWNMLENVKRTYHVKLAPCWNAAGIHLKEVDGITEPPPSRCQAARV